MVFSDYPVIESIDPGSPAEKAGLQAGDILMSINSQDFRKEPIPMNSLLVPGRRSSSAIVATMSSGPPP